MKKCYYEDDSMSISVMSTTISGIIIGSVTFVVEGFNRAFLILGDDMAQKRMFSKSITNSSRFLMMPQSSQNLYFHLGMNADDDGFCEHFTIMRMTESKPDDLKILQAKEFIKVFDDHVLIILDWKENNLIRSDRYTPSKYLEIYQNELKQISGIPNVIPDDNHLEPQVRLGKDSIDKDIYYQNEYFIITQKQHLEYKEVYKTVDIDIEYKKMKIWLDNNPTKRKTKRGYPRFINSWLTRSMIIPPYEKTPENDEKRRKEDENKQKEFRNKLEEQRKNAMTKEELKEAWSGMVRN